MKDKAAKLRRIVKERYEEIKSLNAQLENIEKECKHSWEAVSFSPVHHKAYEFPDLSYQNLPGGSGRSQRPTLRHIPERTEKRWSRTCHNCGKTENTGRTRQQTVAGNIPGTTALAEVPDFGDEPPPTWTVRI